MASVYEKLPNINHDDEVFGLLYKIMTSPVQTLINDENEQFYELSTEISPQDVAMLTGKMKKAFLEQPVLLTINNEPINVVADMHGQSIHLLRILLSCEAPPTQKYLFLGDYVDRGTQSIVVICLLFCLRHRYPSHVFLLRGNHEDVNTTLNYGFYDECVEQWKEGDLGESVWRMFLDAFNCMPLAAVVGGKVFCAHGGISPWIETLEDINTIERPLIVPAYGLACDLLWSDPAQPERNGWGLSHRGISFTYGKSVVDEFCAKNDISLVIRGHQLFKEMYPYGCVLRFGGRLISLFSALNYEGHKNNGSVLKLEFVQANSSGVGGVNGGGASGMGGVSGGGGGVKVKVKQVLFRCRHYAPLKPHEILACRDFKQIQKQEKKRGSRLESLMSKL